MTVLAESDAVEAHLAELRGLLVNLTVSFTRGSTTDRRTLDGLVSGIDHVITLSYSDDLGAQKADARTLVTLLHLRDIDLKRGESFSIVSEILDVRNRQLAEVAEADDFIVSDPKARAHVNPKKSGTVTFAAADKIIVLAEE